jgi:hypothetical protein
MGSIFTQPRFVAVKSKKPYIPKVKKHEENLQKMVCRYLRIQYPNVIFRSDYASGLHLTPYQAKTHASMQSGRAFPDLFIFEPSRGFNGMALELKKEGTTIILKTGARKGKVSSNPHIQEQALMINNLRHKGYYADFGVGMDDCLKKIDWYFNKPQTKEMF